MSPIQDGTDYEHHTLMCEQGKISNIIYNLSQHYTQNDGLGERESNADLGDSHTMSSDSTSD